MPLLFFAKSSILVLIYKLKVFNMRIKILLLVGVIGFVTVGCGSKYPYPSKLSTTRTVMQDTNNPSFYYYSPYGSTGNILTDSNNARNINTYSSGLLQCRKNYAFLYSKIELSKEWYLLNNKVDASITEKEKYMTIPELIKSNKNARKAKNYVTHLAKTNQIECIRPMTKNEVRKYKAYMKKQAKINSDPRVRAAQIQANAMMTNSLMQQQRSIQTNSSQANGHQNYQNNNAGIEYFRQYNRDNYILNRMGY